MPTSIIDLPICTQSEAIKLLRWKYLKCIIVLERYLEILLTLYNFWQSSEGIIAAEINDTDYSYYMRVFLP